MGLVAAGFVLVLRKAGGFHGWPATAVVGLLVLAVPTAKRLSPRLLRTGCLVMGWYQALWWWHISLYGGRVAFTTAVLVGSLAGWVAAGVDVPERLRRLVPAVHAVDCLPLLAGVGAGVVVLPWLRARSSVGGLRLLLTGWDNASHFDMVEMIRQHSSTIDRLSGAPDGTPWMWHQYPQGLHALTVALMELAGSPHPGPVGAEVLGFVHATALVFVAIVVVTVAGICSLDGARRRPGVAAPAAALVWGAFVLGPGGSAMTRGFTNFLLACALSACALVVALTMPRPVSLMHLAALGGALVGVAHNWAPLLVLVLPSVLVTALWTRGWKRWFRDRRQLGMGVGIAMMTAVGLLHAWRILPRSTVSTLVDVAGGIDPPSIGLALAITLAASGVCLAAAARPLWRPRQLHDTAAIAVAPLSGAALAAGLAVHQIRKDGAVSYYFLKYVTGIELVSVVVLAAALLSLARLKESARLPVAGVVLLTAAATQLFGYAGPGSVRLGHAQAAPGVFLATERYTHNLRQDATSSARRLLAAAPLQATHPGQRLVYLALGSRDLYYAPQADQWFRALTGTWSVGALDDGLDTKLAAVGNLRVAVSAARRILAHDPRQAVVVGPDWYPRLTRALADPALQARVLTW